MLKVIHPETYFSCFVRLNLSSHGTCYNTFNFVHYNVSTHGLNNQPIYYTLMQVHIPVIIGVGIMMEIIESETPTTM